MMIGSKGSPKRWAELIARWNVVSAYYRIYTVDELLRALLKTPVVIGIACFKGIFDVPGHGVVPMPSPGEQILGFHAVCTTGFNNRHDKVRFKNSWGTSWGQSGYGKLTYEYLERYMVDAWVVEDMKVSSKDLRGSVSL